jgi:hypothetical protein
MELLKEKCSIALILASCAVLAVRYGVVTIDSLSINAIGVSFDGLKSPNGLLVPVLAIAALAGFSICHIQHHWFVVSDRFRSGYRESPEIVELVRSCVRERSGTARYGSPCGGIRGSLRNRPTDLGQFKRDNGTLSESVVVLPSSADHARAVRSGVSRALVPKLWLGVYGPLVLSAWALIAMTV